MRAMTEHNLKDAFAGESQAHMKYLAFADQAARDGFPQVALLFKAISFAEQVHAAAGAAGSVEDVALALVEFATQAGGHDNITVAVARVGALPVRETGEPSDVTVTATDPSPDSKE